MTARYAHLSPGHLRQAVLKLDGIGLVQEPVKLLEFEPKPITETSILAEAQVVDRRKAEKSYGLSGAVLKRGYGS